MIQATTAGVDVLRAAERRVRGRSEDPRNHHREPARLTTRTTRAEMTALLEPDVLARDSIRDAVGDDDRHGVVVRRVDRPDAQRARDLDTVILGPSVDNDLALDFAERMRASNPTLGVHPRPTRIDAAILLTQALRSGRPRDRGRARPPGLTRGRPAQPQLTFALRNPGEIDGAAGNERTRATCCTVFSPKGGAGKTTFTVNIGVALASKGYQTLLLDLDLAFGDVPISLGLRPEHDFEEIVSMGERLDAGSAQAPRHRARVGAARPGPAHRPRSPRAGDNPHAAPAHPGRAD